MARLAQTASLVVIGALASCVASFEGLVGGEPAAGADAAGSDVTLGNLPRADGSPQGDATQADAPEADGTQTDATPPSDAANEPFTVPDDAPTGPDKLFVYAAYEGGPFTIDVDKDEPGIIIGLVAAEPVTVNITGAFKGRVKAVHFAGRSAAAAGTTISGVPTSIVSVAAQPAATPDGRGASTIQCQYEGGARYNDAGCNTREQIDAYFHSKFSGAIAVHGCRFAAYSGTLILSAGATCDCIATTCADEGKACGPYPDGCGGSLDCGGCAVGTCGGFGVANQCGGCTSGQTTVGPRSPAIAGNLASGVPSAATWTNPLQVVASDDLRAAATMFPTYPTTDYLRATKFGFAIPSNTTVKGVYLEVEASNDLPFASFRDWVVSLVVQSAPAGSDYARAAPWAPSDLINVPKDHIRVYGGPTDNWGLPLTDAEVNSDNFGAAVRANYTSPSGSGHAGIDSLRMWLCY